MTHDPACYQDVNDVLDLSYVPKTSEDIEVDDILDLSYVPNTAEDIVLTQAPAPMTTTPGGHTCGNTPFSPRVRDLVLEFKKGIKLVPESFAELKDNKQWDSVHWTLKAQTACYHQRVSYASGDFDAKYIPGIVFLIPGITRIQFTVLRSCGIPKSPFCNFVLAYP